jgi:LPS-assembly lipoprotein
VLQQRQAVGAAGRGDWRKTDRVRKEAKMKQVMRLLAAGVLLVTLSACGFKPLYGNQADGAAANAGRTTVSELSQVRIIPLSDRPGQLLHNELRNEINPRGQSRNPSYDLRVSLQETKQELAIRQDETATRANLRLQAKFTLLKNGAAERLFSGSSLSIVSYDIVDSEYATYTAEKNARQRGIRELAENIHLRLASYFSQSLQGNRQSGGADKPLAQSQ